MKKILHVLKVVGPWLVAMGIFAWLFHLYPPSTLLDAIKQVQILPFVSFAIFYALVAFVVDSWVFARVLTRFHHPVTYTEILPARAVTYLIMILNYGASQVAFAYYLKRIRQVPIFEVLGIFVFIALIDLYFLIVMAVIGSCVQPFSIRGVALNPSIQLVGLVATVAAALHLLYWRYFSQKPWRFTAWLRRRKLFRIFHEARLRDYVVTAVMRTPIYVLIISFMYVVLLTFNAYVPMIIIVGTMPIAFLVGVLPISPGGIGVTNAALVELLQDHVTGPQIASGQVTAPAIILTASLLWLVANTLIKALLGVFYMRRVSKTLFEPTPDDDDSVKSPAPLG